MAVRQKSLPKAMAGLGRGLVFVRKNRWQVLDERILVDLGPCLQAEG